MNSGVYDVTTVLGKSLNIFAAGYVETEDLKVQIFKFPGTTSFSVGQVDVTAPQKAWGGLDILQFTQDNDEKGEGRSGETLDKYGSSFMSKSSLSGAYKLFSGSVSTEFSKSESQTRQTRFASHDYCRELGTFDIDIREYPKWYEKNKSQFLDSRFVHHLNGMDPSEFFRTYGTHWLRKISMGGRYLITTYAEYVKTITETQLKIAAEASYGAFVQANTENKWKGTEAHKSQDIHWSYRAIGGNLALANNKVDDWRASITTSPTVIRYDEVVPLWYFLEHGSTRFNEMEKAFEELRANYRLPRPIFPVEVWNYPNYSGRSAKFQLGEYTDLDLTDIKRNEIDSIKIPDGVVVTAWSYPGFSQKKYGPYRGPIEIPQVCGINNWDSMKIELSEDVPPFVEIFSYPGYRYDENCASVFVGEYPDLVSLNTENWRNAIDSIKIPEGLKVTAWSHPHYQQTQYGPYTSDQTLVAGQNDWDSMKVEKIE